MLSRISTAEDSACASVVTSSPSAAGAPRHPIACNAGGVAPWSGAEALAHAVEILDCCRPVVRREVVRTDRALAMATGDVEDVDRLAQSRPAAAQGAHQRLAALDGHPEMAGARREIAVMEIVGLHPAFDET